MIWKTIPGKKFNSIPPGENTLHPCIKKKERFPGKATTGFPEVILPSGEANKFTYHCTLEKVKAVLLLFLFSPFRNNIFLQKPIWSVSIYFHRP